MYIILTEVMSEVIEQYYMYKDILTLIEYTYRLVQAER